jgi:hypothetical protein
MGRRLRCLTWILAVSPLIFTSLCQAGDTPIPEYYGIYLVANEKLYSLDAPDASLEELRQPVRLSRTEKEFEGGGGLASVPTLPDSLSFLVFAKGSPLDAAELLKLRQLSFVRTMTINDDDVHYRQTYHLNTWVAATGFGYAGVGETEIKLRFKPVKGEDEMVLAVPASPLQPGIYILGNDFAFAVQPLDAAATSKCIETSRAVGLYAAWRTWPCAQASTTSSGPTTAVPPSRLRAEGTAGGQVAGPVTGSELPNSCGQDNSSALSSPEQLPGVWVGELKQGSQRYSVEISLETGGSGEVTGTIDYPGLRCKGTLHGSSSLAGDRVVTTLTETIRLADRLRCLSGSKVELASAPKGGGLIAQWFSRTGAVVARGLLCRN